LFNDFCAIHELTGQNWENFKTRCYDKFSAVFDAFVVESNWWTLHNLSEGEWTQQNSRSEGGGVNVNAIKNLLRTMRNGFSQLDIENYFQKCGEVGTPADYPERKGDCDCIVYVFNKKSTGEIDYVLSVEYADLRYWLHWLLNGLVSWHSRHDVVVFDIFHCNSKTLTS